jgi:hypothetical protein
MILNYRDLKGATHMIPLPEYHAGIYAQIGDMMFSIEDRHETLVIRTLSGRLILFPEASNAVAIEEELPKEPKP